MMVKLVKGNRYRFIDTQIQFILGDVIVYGDNSIKVYYLVGFGASEERKSVSLTTQEFSKWKENVVEKITTESSNTIMEEKLPKKTYTISMENNPSIKKKEAAMNLTPINQKGEAVDMKQQKLKPEIKKDLNNILLESIEDIRNKKIDANTANSIAKVGQTLINALKLDDK